jgi:hypothetical protein
MTIHPVARGLFLAGLFLIFLGFCWQFGGRFLQLGRLPGDVVIKKENFQFYFPIMTSILLSIIFSLVAYLVRRFL